MSLPHALLTALTERPGAGSELAARFDKSIGHFWHATHQQIYRELARLEAAGHIASLPEATTRGRKRAYRILPAGRKELKRWLAEDQPPATLRDALLLRLRAAAAVGAAGLAPQLRAHLAQHRQQLALYEGIAARDFTPAPTTREAALQQVVLQAGIHYERNWVVVLEQALAALELPPA